MLSHITAKDVGDPFWATVCKTVALCYRTVVCLSVTSVCYGLTVGWIMMPLGTEVGLGLGDIVLDEDLAPSPRGTQPPQFSAHVCCGQTAGWMKMALGMEVGFGPGDIVRWGSRSPKKGHSTPGLLVPCLLWPNGRPSQLLLSTCLNILCGILNACTSIISSNTSFPSFKLV